MRIFILVDQMALGGASRVAQQLIMGLAERGYDIVLETNVSKGLFYNVPDSVRIEPAVSFQQGKGLLYKIRYRIQRFKRHRKLLRRYCPDVAIAFFSSMFMELYYATRGLDIPIVVSDHTSMSRDLGCLTNFIRHRLYGLGNATTILTEKDYNFLGSHIANKVVIPNPLPFKPMMQEELAGEVSRKKAVLCVGRVDYWKVKGFDHIIKMWRKIKGTHPDWQLHIAGPGTGVGELYLKELAQENEVRNEVVFLGNITDMKSLYRQYPIFALPSRVEGFPMVLIEAMSQGCAAISFSLEKAIEEIINDGVDGVIVSDNDTESFEEKLETLMDNTGLRNAISKNAIRNIGRFSLSSFIDRWETIISNVDKSQKHL